MRGGVGAGAGMRTREGASGRGGAPAGPVRPGPGPLGVRIGRALGVTSTRRAAMLAVVILAVALSVAVPLRNYLSQRSELAAVREQQQILADQVAELERRRALLTDPRHIEAQARERLRYVQPGETPYVVQLPPPPAEPPGAEDRQPDAPWLSRLWESIVGG